MRLVYVVLALVYIHQATSHLCLLEPRQRGPLDISMGGSPTCSRHSAPCGGQAAEEPDQSYAPGDKIFFKWQQNLNHYEPGYPGYFDISIAPTPTSTNMTTLVVVADKYVHAQDYQENITAILTAPNIECEHCVIYARYRPHKPTEGTFYQCADIKIFKNAKKSDDTLRFTGSKTHKERRRMLPLKRALKLKLTTDLKYNWNAENDDVKLYGIAYNPFQPQRSHYISVGVRSGKTEMLMTYNFGIDAPVSTTKDDEPKTYMVDEVIAVDNLRNVSYVIVHKDGSRDDIAKMVYNIGSSNGSFVQISDVFAFEGGAINGLTWYTDGTSATFRIQPENTGSYMFEVGTLDFGGMYTKRASIPKPENLYVNFQWFETQADNYQIVYALMGNENAPDELNARIYAFDVYNGKYLRYVELDITEYTFMSMHSYPGSGETLYAFSPGLWFNEIEAWAWTLVEIDANKGTVTKKCDVAPAGVFDRFYGGSVFQGAKNTDGFLYHVLRVQNSETDFIVAVNPVTCEVRFSEATNLRHVHSLQKLSPQMIEQ